MTEKKTKKRKRKKIKYRAVLNYDLRKLRRSVVIGDKMTKVGYSKEADAE